MNICRSLLRKGIWLILSVIVVLPVDAQYKFPLKGKIIDKNTSDPVPFATIVVKGEAFGVITNHDGTFSVPFDRVQGRDSLKISCLGYQPLMFAVSSFRNKDVLTIPVSQQSYSIEEVTVKGKKIRRPSARKMILKAISLLEENYPVDPFLIDAYYRDYLKINNKYMNLYEAHVEIEDMGFYSNDYSTSNIRLINGGFNPDFGISRSMIWTYDSIKRIPNGILNYDGGNELAILRLVDPVRNRDEKTTDYINNIKSDFCKNHVFSFEDVVYLEKRPVYKLGFKTSRDMPDIFLTSSGSYATLGVHNEDITSGAKGQVYIDAGSYSILKLVYQANVSDWIHGDYKIWELAVEYKMINNTAYLSYLSFNNAVEFPDFSDNSYLYLKNLIFDKRNSRIGLEFNNELDESSVDDTDFCRLLLNGRKVEFRTYEIRKNYAYLYPEDFLKIYTDKGMIDTTNLDVRIKKIKDKNGNVFGKYNFETAYQYRELFVRGLEFNYDKVATGSILDKKKSMVALQDSTHTGINREYFNSPLIGKE